MVTKKRLVWVITILVITTMALATFTAQAVDSVQNIDPWESSGGAVAECGRLGFSYGFKIDSPVPLSGTVYPTGNTSYFSWSSSDNVNFTWSSSFGIDVVIMKAGQGANVFTYDPESTGGVVYTPDGKDISHITFCWDYDPLTVTKTANTSYTRTYTWTIDKSVDISSHVGFTGDSFRSKYTITLDRTDTDSEWAISGSITIDNTTNPLAANITVVDEIDGGIGVVATDCPTVVLEGQSVTCSYSASPGGQVGTLNTATVTSSTPQIAGGVGTAPIVWGDPTTVVGYPTVNVTDSNGPSSQFNGDGSVSYEKGFVCDGDAGTHPNVATIVETGQSDDASVTVNCYALTVTKNAATTFAREWDWSIDKSADQTDLTLSTGQVFAVNYAIKVDAVATDSAWAVNGGISVYNPAPIAATINSVSDVVSNGIVATVTCPVTFPYTLTAGGTLNCTYAAGLPDATARLNTATAVLQNYNYNTPLGTQPGGTTNFTGTADVIFNLINPTVETDECINLSDAFNGGLPDALGSLCANAGGSYAPFTFTFNYSRQVGPYDTCGDYVVENIASFVTNDTGTTGSDTWTVNVNVPCGGCTLTQGYWKTHSQAGPAPYDDAWGAIGDFDNDTLLEEHLEDLYGGGTWYDVFWTPPAGDVWYNLAHQYMAAKLNVVNGAFAPAEVASALTTAEGLLSSYTPPTNLKGQARKAFTDAATILDNYNNGLIGPGHCDE